MISKFDTLHDEILNEMSRLGYVSVKNKEYELRLYDEIGVGKQIHIHVIPTDKSFEVTIDPYTMNIIEWKHYKTNTSLPKALIDSIKSFFKSKFTEDPKKTNWQYFIETWNVHNQSNKRDKTILPKWWNI